MSVLVKISKEDVSEALLLDKEVKDALMEKKVEIQMPNRPNPHTGHSRLFLKKDKEKVELPIPEFSNTQNFKSWLIEQIRKEHL